MHFLRLAENSNLPGNANQDAEAFFYFISKLNQIVQTPICRTCLDEQGFVYWVLSDEVVEEIKNEKNKWHRLSYSDANHYLTKNKLLVDQEISNSSLNAQEWLDRKYPDKEERTEILRIHLNERNLEGELDLSGFKKLGSIHISWYLTDLLDEKKLILKNPPYRHKVVKYSNAQKWLLTYLNNYHSQQNLQEITELNIRGKNVEGNLKLEGFTSLEKLDCSINQLTGLNLQDCPNLKILNCSDNFLTNLDLSQNSKLKSLDINNNNFAEQDLSFLSHLNGLKELKLGNEEGNSDSWRIQQNIYNYFIGSLELLQNLTKLKEIDIRNTDLNSGLEYLPDGIEAFYCVANARKDAKCKAIFDTLAEANRDEKGRKRKLETNATGKIMNFHQIFKQYKEINEISNLLDQAKEELTPEQIKVTLLEEQVQELIDLIKKQRGKIADAYLHFCEEEKLLNSKELLRELIVNHLEIVKIRKQNVTVDEYEEQLKQYNDIRLKLFNKLNDWKLIEEVEKILKDCEGLVDLEAELKTKLESKQLLIEEKKQNLQITDGKEKRELTLYKKKKISELEEKHQRQIKQHQGLSNRLLEFAKSEKKGGNSNKPDLKHPPIGKGGYGEVYYGKWKLQDVAVKKLYLSLHNTSKSDLKDIYKEIDILKNLRNRHIIQYYDTYSDAQELFIIMDYAENGTLTKFINDNEDKEHDWSFNTNLIKQIALGLAYIHQQGVIHRDLKSTNVLLTDGYQVKISDFGLSKTKNISSSQSKHSNTGTLRWMAPELLRGQKYSEQSDIYALGMIMWEIAAKCTTPFKDIDNNLVGFRIISGEKEVIPNDVPQNIQGIIKGSWKDNPDERITLENILAETDENGKANLHNCALGSSNLSQSLSSEKSLMINLEMQNLDINQPYSNDQIIISKSAETTSKPKRQLSSESQAKTNQGETKQTKTEYYSAEPMEIDYSANNWINIHPSFTPQLAQNWFNHSFTYQQTRDWINISLTPNDYQFAYFLKNIKQLTLEEVLNHGNLENLKQEFQTYQQNQQQALQIQAAYGTPGSSGGKP